MEREQINVDNGLTLQSRVCPLCGNAHFSVVGRGYDYDYRTTFFLFEYRRCLQCEIVYPNYQPIYGQLDKVYGEVFWHDKSKVIYRTSLKSQLLFRNGRLLRRLCRLAEKKPNFKLLDIGSGAGGMFCVLKEAFPKGEYHSIDLTKEISDPKIFHRKGYFEDYDFGGEKFDVITSQHNIEHVYSPRDYFIKASSLLEEEGFIFIVTPNVDALEFKIFKKKLYCAGYSIPRHLSLFNEHSFRKLVDSIKGLQVESINHFFTIHHTVGLVHHLIYDLIKSERVDKWINYNNIFLSIPFYLFELIRYLLGFKTGVLEATLIKSSTLSGR